MKRIAWLFILAGGVVALAAWQLAPVNHSPGAALSGGAALQTAASPEASVAPAAGAGYVVHFDANGRIVEEVTPEEAAEFNAQLNQVINTSQEGLVERATPAGGGMMVDLQGRFESAATATIDATGKVNVPCLTNENDVRTFTAKTAADRAATKE